MGREIRRVPPTWEHPRRRDIYGSGYIDDDVYVPCFDQNYVDAAELWMADYARWMEDRKSGQDSPYKYYWECAYPPKEINYRTGKFVFLPSEATHYQIYQTVTEGTPKSPVFETLEQMETWLIEGGVSPMTAAEFVKNGWAPSAMISPSGEVTLASQLTERE